MSLFILRLLVLITLSLNVSYGDIAYAQDNDIAAANTKQIQPIINGEGTLFPRREGGKIHKGKTSEQWADYIINELGPKAKRTQPLRESTQDPIYLEMENLLSNVRKGDIYRKEISSFYEKIKDTKDIRLLKVHTLLAQYNQGSLEIGDYIYDDDWFIKAVGSFLFSKSITRKSGHLNVANLLSTTETLDLLSVGNEKDYGYGIIKSQSFYMRSLVESNAFDIEKFVQYTKKSKSWSYLNSKSETQTSLANAAGIHFKIFRDFRFLDIVSLVDKNDPAIANQITALNYNIGIANLKLGNYDKAILILENKLHDKGFIAQSMVSPALAVAYAAQGNRKQAAKHINLSKEITDYEIRNTIFIRYVEIFLSIQDPSSSDLARFEESIRAADHIVHLTRLSIAADLKKSNQSSYRHREYLTILNKLQSKQETQKHITIAVLFLMALSTVSFCLVLLRFRRAQKELALSELERIDNQNKLSDTLLANQLWSRSLQDSFGAHDTSISSLENARTFDLVKKNINNWASKINETLAGTTYFPIAIVNDYQEMTDVDFIQIVKGKTRTLNAIYDSTLDISFRGLPTSFVCNLSFIEISLTNILNKCLSASTLNVISCTVNHETMDSEHYIAMTLKDDHGILGALTDIILESAMTKDVEATFEKESSAQATMILNFPITNPMAKIVAINEN